MATEEIYIVDAWYEIEWHPPLRSWNGGGTSSARGSFVEGARMRAHASMRDARYIGNWAKQQQLAQGKVTLLNVKAVKSNRADEIDCTATAHLVCEVWATSMTAAVKRLDQHVRQRLQGACCRAKATMI